MLSTIIFIGRSGSGKGTQADLLKNFIAENDPNKHQILYVETGEHFRTFVRGESYSSKISKEIYDKDERQPDFLACSMWSKTLIEELGEDMHLVFDGTPRSKNEAVILSTALNFYKREKPLVLFINVSRKWSEERLLARGRSDDKSLTKIDKRLDWFDKDVTAAIEYLKSELMYRFVEVDGEQSIEKVHADIIEAYQNEHTA